MPRNQRYRQEIQFLPKELKLMKISENTELKKQLLSLISL